jgi:uncharacterized protein YbcI
MHLDEKEPARTSPTNAISNASVQIVREYTGRGPTKAKTIISRDMVVILFQNTLTRAEHSLVAAGKSELVIQMRQEFQRTMRDDLVAVVESNTGRKVIAFMSANHIDPDMAAETFVLEPQAEEDGQGNGASAS